jgi:lysophospholipase L1-like esterase
MFISGLRKLRSNRRQTSGKTKPKRIMVFSDSNSLRPETKGLSWPSLLEIKAKGTFRVLNESYEGRTTQYDRGERNGVKMIKRKLNTHSPLHFVVVMLGTNDLKMEYGPPSVKEISRGIGKIIEIIVDYDENIKPVIITPPPAGVLNSGQLTGAHNQIADIAAEYEVLSNSLELPFIDLREVINVSNDLEPDRIHINSFGRMKIAESAWDYMQKFLEKSSDIENRETRL